ncbi:MAG: hypothetical protein ACLRIS_03925 [Flavonifractor plautii]
MKSLNPACKLIGLVVPTLLLAGLHHPAVNLAVFAVCLAALLLSRANVKVLAGALLPCFWWRWACSPPATTFTPGRACPSTPPPRPSPGRRCGTGWCWAAGYWPSPGWACSLSSPPTASS